MPFPAAERVIYEHNPLIQVICQVRFPGILRIETNLPADFQDRIRHVFPIVQDKPEKSLPLPLELQDTLPSELKSLLTRNVAYEFVSADEKWTVTLTRDFLSLSTSDYRQWERFRELFQEPLDALRDVYHPAYFTRIGLRYQNLIVRSKIGLHETKWSNLIQPHLAGALTIPDIENLVEGSQQAIVVNLREDSGKVRIQHGLVTVEETKEITYLIDNDFFTEQRTEVGNETAILDRYHQTAGRLFRWCITPNLHDAMGPKEISDNTN